jgi:hypothetical protein
MWDIGVIVKDDSTTPKGTPAWRDPVGLSFKAHRGVLLLRLRWHATVDKRRPPQGRRRHSPSPR